jgi:hypothetical protein
MNRRMPRRFDCALQWPRPMLTRRHMPMHRCVGGTLPLPPPPLPPPPRHPPPLPLPPSIHYQCNSLLCGWLIGCRALRASTIAHALVPNALATRMGTHHITSPPLHTPFCLPSDREREREREVTPPLIIYTLSVYLRLGVLHFGMYICIFVYLCLWCGVVLWCVVITVRIAASLVPVVVPPLPAPVTLNLSTPVMHRPAPAFVRPAILVPFVQAFVLGMW